MKFYFLWALYQIFPSRVKWISPYCCALGGWLDTGWAEVFVIFLDSDNFHPVWGVLLCQGPGSADAGCDQLTMGRVGPRVTSMGNQSGFEWSVRVAPASHRHCVIPRWSLRDCILFHSGWWECDTWHRVSQPGARMLHKNNFSKSWPGPRHSRKFSAFTWCHMIITIRSRVTL